jgi:pantetheine-phosphate adenylyltransferase
VTNGHLDVIERTSRVFDEVVVAVLVNKSKAGMFTTEERIALLEASTSSLPNVTVESFYGLLVDFCKAKGISVMVKGLRAVSDFDYELQMGQMNHALAGVETLFMPTNPLYSFTSSSLVKEVATFGGDVERLVPPPVLDALKAKLSG